MTRRLLAAEVEAIVSGGHTNPHDFLGHHGGLVRVWRPGAKSVRVAGTKAEQIHDAGLFEARVAETATDYDVEVTYTDGTVITFDDPYRHWPTLGEVDLYLIGEGRHERLWEVLGAHHRVHNGSAGTAFAVWAPSARAIRVVGDFDLWDGRVHPMRSMGSSGVWELFVPGVEPGSRYKFEVVGADSRLRLKADPMAQLAEKPPGTSSIVTTSHHEWSDDEWLARRAGIDTINQRMSTYELHLGSWRHKP